MIVTEYYPSISHQIVYKIVQYHYLMKYCPETQQYSLVYKHVVYCLSLLMEFYFSIRKTKLFHSGICF